MHFKVCWNNANKVNDAGWWWYGWRWSALWGSFRREFVTVTAWRTPKRLALVKARLRGSAIFEVQTDVTVVRLGGTTMNDLCQAFWDAAAGDRGGRSNSKGMSGVVHVGNAGQGENRAEVLVEPETPNHLSRFGDEERFHLGYTLRIMELRKVCEDCERVKGWLNVKVKDGSVGWPDWLVFV